METPEQLITNAPGLITKEWTQKLARILKRLEIGSVVGGKLRKDIHGQYISIDKTHRRRPFEPTWLQGSSPKLSIQPGYVYAPYDSDSSTHLPMINQWPFEPKIGTTLLTADTPPSLALTVNTTNYIYLKLTWDSFEDEIGGSDYGSEHAFKAAYNLQVTIGGTPSAVEDGPAGYDPGIFTPITKETYYLTGAEFISHTASATPPTESETETNLLAGYATLNGSAQIISNGKDDATRWFLSGPVFTSKPPTYKTGGSSDRAEPVAPIAPSGQDIPGVS